MNIRSRVSLQPYNTFGLDVTADLWSEVLSLDDLSALFSAGNLSGQPLLVLGGGSNMLFTQDFDGLVLKMGIKGIDIVQESDEWVEISVGAGENWHELVLFCVQQNWGGIENLSLIPGLVGASPIQNIGAYGVELKDVFVELTAFEIATGKSRTFSPADCDFGYRDSVFKRHFKGKFIITQVTLRLMKNPVINTSYGAIETELARMGEPPYSIKDVSDAVIYIRQSKLPDPAKIGNSGSFFKNPEIPRSQFDALKMRFPNIVGYPISEEIVKVPAGWLIDKAGWKGKTFGNYGVHVNQALVLVNYGGADGKDIYDLSEEILQSVQERYGITLEREVNVV